MDYVKIGNDTSLRITTLGDYDLVIQAIDSTLHVPDRRHRRSVRTLGDSVVLAYQNRDENLRPSTILLTPALTQVAVRSIELFTQGGIRRFGELDPHERQTVINGRGVLDAFQRATLLNQRP